MRNYPTARLVMGALLVFAVTALGTYWIGSKGGDSTSMAMNQVRPVSGIPAAPQIAPGQHTGMPRFIVTDIQTRPSTPKPKPKK